MKTATPPKRRGYSSKFPHGKTRSTISADQAPPDLKKAFSDKCKAKGVSMREVLLQFCMDYSGWQP